MRITRRRPDRWSLDDAKARAAGLSADGAPEGLRNLGLDGSYMVVRQLQQRVGAFWKSLEDNAARIRAHDPRATHVTAEWLAERIIGRNIDGHLLCPSGVLAADEHRLPAERLRLQEDRSPRRRLPGRLARAPSQSARRPGERPRVGADLARCCEQPPDPAARAQVRHHARQPQSGRWRGSRAPVHLPEHGHRTPVRVRAADLAVESEFRDAVRRDRPAGRTQGPLHDPGGSAAAHRRGRNLHPVGRRRLLLPAEHAGAELSGSVYERDRDSRRAAPRARARSRHG